MSLAVVLCIKPLAQESQAARNARIDRLDRHSKARRNLAWGQVFEVAQKQGFALLWPELIDGIHQPALECKKALS